MIKAIRKRVVTRFEALQLFYIFETMTQGKNNDRQSISFVLLLVFLALFTYSCKKESEKKYCWQIIDNVGNNMGVVCDKTEAELVSCVNNRTCGVFFAGTISSCFYYKAGGEEFCWLIDSSYMLRATENKLAHLKRCFNLSSKAEKIDCSYCQFWYNRKKSIYKPDGRFAYSSVTHQQYCGDTARTLYQGREVVIKNDADSLIVIQFSSDGRSW